MGEGRANIPTVFPGPLTLCVCPTEKMRSREGLERAGQEFLRPVVMVREFQKSIIITRGRGCDLVDVGLKVAVP